MTDYKMELVHDLLAQQIFARFSEEEKALRRATRMLQQAQEFHQEQIEKGEAGRFLSSGELAYIQQFEARLSLSPNQKAYMQASANHLEKERLAKQRQLEKELARQRRIRSLQRVLLAGGGVVVLAMIFFTRYTLNQNEQLEQKIIQTHIASAESALNQGNFTEALQQYDSALVRTIDTTIQNRRNNIEAFSSHIKKGDKYAKRDQDIEPNANDYLQADQAYSDALEVFNDNRLAQDRLSQLRQTIKQEGIRFARIGELFIANNDRQMAYKYLSKADSLIDDDNVTRLLESLK